MQLEQVTVGKKVVVSKEKILESNELSSALEELEEEALSVAVQNDEDYRYAAELLNSVEGLGKMVESIAEEFRKPAYELYQTALAKKKAMLKPFESARSHLRGLMTGYVEEQERIRKEEERKRLQAQREKEQEEALRRLEEAAEAEDEFGAEVAEIEFDAASKEVTDDEIEIEAPEAEGVSFREDWKAELVDLKALCLAVAKGKAPTDLISYNSGAANKLARALKDDFDVPGLKAKANKVLVRR